MLNDIDWQTFTEKVINYIYALTFNYNLFFKFSFYEICDSMEASKVSMITQVMHDLTRVFQSDIPGSDMFNACPFTREHNRID